jgi:spermidine/putrescine-binding protein
MIATSRRTLLAGLAALSSGGFATRAFAQQAELVLSGFGGAYDEAMAESLKSFEQQHRVKVRIVPGSGANNIARVRNKEIDVIVSDPVFALRMEAERSFAKLDSRLVPNLAALYPKAILSEAVAAANFGGYVLAFNQSKISPPPSSWYDLAKPEYRGRISLRGFRPENIELMVLFAKLAGGDERNLEAGWAQMAKIAKNIDVWITGHAEHLELYRNDQISMSMWTDGRIAWAREQEGVNVQASIPKEGFFPIVSTVSAVAGRPNAELAQKLVNHLLSPEAGIRMAEKLGYFPSNTAAVLPAEVQEKILLNPNNIGSLKIADWKYLVTVYDKMQVRWEKEIQR